MSRQLVSDRISEQIHIRNSARRRLEYFPEFYCEELQQIFDDPDSRLEAGSNELLQDNFKSTIGVIHINTGKIVIKRHNFKSRWQQVKRLFRKTKPRNSWNYSRILRNNNILVPRPVACLEKCYGPLKGISYFFYEYVEGVQGEEYFRQNAASPKVIASAMQEILNTIDTLTSLKLIHGDIRLANFLFGNGQIYLLDFDDVRPRSWYKSSSAKDRDIRGFRKDLCYNTTGTLRQQVLTQLDSYCKKRNITISGPDYRKLVD